MYNVEQKNTGSLVRIESGEETETIGNAGVSKDRRAGAGTRSGRMDMESAAKPSYGRKP